MKILLLNQAFYPDVVSTAQHASDLGRQLAASGHQVSVISSRRAYDDPSRAFRKRETWQGVVIRRVSSLGLGKASKLRRALNFASFLFCCAVRLARTPKCDVVIAMTSPPLIAYVASLFVRWKGGRLVYWVMDLNPDEAIAAGWLKQNSMVARLLTWMLESTLRRAHKIIVLDRFMRDRVLQKGIAAERIETIPPWSHDHALRYDPEGRTAFRQEHGLTGKFVVMYSGNHSPCHPLDSLLQAALALRSRPELVFLFVGGGSEQAKVRDFARRHQLNSVRCLPYQPTATLSASLSAADVHAVVMGDLFVGLVHPCKVYNILLLGIPILYVGPNEAHIPDLAAAALQTSWFYGARHGEIDKITSHILTLACGMPKGAVEQRRIAAAFAADVLMGKLQLAIEGRNDGCAPVIEAASLTLEALRP